MNQSKVGVFVEIEKLQDWNIVEIPSIDLGPFDSNRPAKTGFPSGQILDSMSQKAQTQKSQSRMLSGLALV
ncbi:hypothetical protein ACFSKL_01480 [Belliella marina]|uniref:Uncharacterized protein n=1 Tax=Belliella marina TaxID=1644146 RepID=A0ABW4VI11_9BACT